jgi:hypothetical protein
MLATFVGAALPLQKDGSTAAEHAGVDPADLPYGNDA